MVAIVSRLMDLVNEYFNVSFNVSSFTGSSCSCIKHFESKESVNVMITTDINVITITLFKLNLTSEEGSIFLQAFEETIRIRRELSLNGRRENPSYRRINSAGNFCHKFKSAIRFTVETSVPQARAIPSRWTARCEHSSYPRACLIARVLS